jgi:hypothetical protein
MNKSSFWWYRLAGWSCPTKDHRLGNKVYLTPHYTPDFLVLSISGVNEQRLTLSQSEWLRGKEVELLDVDPRTIQRSLRRLEAEGLITRVERGRDWPDGYLVRGPKAGRRKPGRGDKSCKHGRCMRASQTIVILPQKDCLSRFIVASADVCYQREYLKKKGHHAFDQ